MLGLASATQAQNKLYMNPVKYTDRRVYTYNHVCGNQNQVHFTLNGQQLPGYQFFWFASGLGFIEFDFGTLKPGDVLTVSDECGSTPFSQTITDDYVYVEIPVGQSHASNGIPPGDETSPYNRLSTPLAVGRCEPVSVGAHGLHTYSFFASTNTKGITSQIGQFLVNGNPLTAAGHQIAHIGYQGAVNYTIGADGSLAFDGPVQFISQQFYSGQTPLTIEYHHNGAVYSGDLDLRIGAMSFRYISNTGFAIQKATYTSAVSEKDFTGDYSHSVFKITYDGHYFRAYVDNVLVDELERFVVFDAQAGSLSNTGVLPYGSSVTFSPTQPGVGWVGVLVDGVLYTRQQLSIADDLSLNPTVINAGCSGAATGQISLAVTGGKSPFQYNLNGGAYSASNTFTGLSSTTYTVGVRDASGCTATRTVTVSQPPTLGLTIASKTDVSCSGNTNGTVSLSPAGGTGPFQYSQSGGAYGSSANFTGLAAGGYTFSVKDVNGCSASVSTTLTTQSNLALSVTSLQNIACFGGSTGAISVTTTGSSVGAVQYSINSGASQASSQFTGLGAGTYTLTAQDNLCRVSLPVSLSQPPALGATATITQAIHCYNGADGAVTVAGNGGVTAYQFSADGSAYQTAANFSGLARGNYKYWVKDANGCVATTGILTLNDPTALQLTVTDRTDAGCFGGATGSLTVAASGGVSPYTYTRTGTSFGASGQFTGLVAASYTLQTKDANGCLASTSATIGQPAVLQGGLSNLQAVACSGGSDGALSLSATGGTSPYRFAQDGTSFTSTNTFRSLSEGVYTLTIRDANNCQITVPATIGYQSRLLLSIASVKPVGCFGESTGGMTASATGSTAVGTLLYSLDGTNYQPAAQFTGLAAGNYTLHLKDNLCQVSQAFVVTQPTALAASASVIQPVACWGGSSGLNRVAASGGTTPYQYSANGTAYQNSADFGNLSVNSYTYWVKDANGCTLTTSPVSVTQPTLLQLGVSSRSDVRCFDGADGAVSLTATGGSPGYSFALPTAAYQTSSQFSGLRVASYTARVQDTHGCVTSLSIVVGQPQAPFTLAVTSRKSLTCYQDNGGQFSVAGSGGTAPYQYALNNGTLSPVGTFTSLAAGTYLLSGKDAQGCTAQLTGQTLTQPDEIVLSLLRKVDVDCEYYTRGEIQLSAVGGNGSYVFSMSGQDRRGVAITSSPTADGIFKALAAGNYLITARDGAGCTGDYTVAISPRNSAIRFNVQTQPPASCQQATGQLVVENVVGGRPPYSYGISTQAGLSSNPRFDNLAGGSYLITVADSLCLYTQPVSLTLANSLRADYTLTPRDCRTPNADLQLTNIQGGSGAYQVSLNNGPLTSTRNFTNLAPGIYALRLEDVPSSCPTILSLEVLPQNGAGLRLTDRQAVKCWQGSDGQLTVTAEATTGPFRYAIDGGSFRDDPRFTGLLAGVHRVVVQNRLGCLDSMRVLITQPPLLNLAVTTKDNDCFGDQTGAVTAAASGGVSPYTYSTDGTNYVSNTTLGSLRAGGYSVRVRDANGCVTTQAATLQQPTVLTLQPLYADTVRCQGETNGRVRLVAGGGTPTYQYSIDSLSYAGDNQFGGLRAGTYHFWVQDGHQCRTKASLTLTEPTKLQLKLLSQLDPLCYGDSSGKAQVVASGGNGGYQYTTNNGLAQPSGSFTGLTQASYGFRVVDRRGCTDTTATRIRLTWPAPITSSFVTKQPRCWGEANGEVTVSIQGGTSPYQTTGPGNPTTSPVFAFVGLTAGPYVLPFTDSHGCGHQVSLTLEQPTALSVQTTIKPNDCFGDQTGSITVVGQGATAPYRYAIGGAAPGDTSFQASGQFSQLRSATYSIRVVDAHGCQLIQPTLVPQPTAVTLQAIYADTVRCFGETNGRVQLLAGGGVSGYRYAVDTTRYYADPVFGDLKAGTYTFWVKDQNGCRQSTSLPVTEPAKMRLSLTDRIDPLCAGDQNGIINVSASGGNSGYTYWLDNRLAQSTGRFIGLTQAEYTLKAVDRRGCEDTIRRVVLTWPKPLAAAIQTQTPRCFGDANGTVGIQLTGGVGTYSGTLSGTTAPITGKDSLRYANLAAGRYEVAITDQNGCALRLPVVIPIPDKLLPIQLGDSAVVCKGQTVTLDSKNPDQQVAWSLNGQSLSTKSVITVVDPGVYSVSVKNATGCETTGQFRLINSSKAMNADFLMAVQAFVGDTVYALNVSSPSADFVDWTFPTEAYLVEQNASRAGFVVVTPGKYTINMLATKEDCRNNKQRDIEIFDRKDIGQTDPQLGYQDQINFSKVTVYPNPNYGKFKLQIDLSQTSDVEVTITRSLNSAQVYKTEAKGQTAYSFEISLTAFVQDIYVIVIRAGKSTYKQKVLIMN
ncbi:hypothetical protein GCM10028810_63550 [Spirosoma litoris]